MIRAAACKTKRGSRGKAPRGRGTTTGGAESKKRGEGGREKETGGGTEEASGGRETTERGSGETDEGRGGTAATKGGGSTGGGCTDATKELVEEDESGTIGVSSVRGGDEFDRLTPLDEKITGLVSPQGDSRATPGAGRNGERVGNRANGCR